MPFIFNKKLKSVCQIRIKINTVKIIWFTRKLYYENRMYCMKS